MRTWRLRPDDDLDDVAMLDDLVRRAHLTLYEAGAHLQPGRFGWRVGYGTAQAWIALHMSRLTTSGTYAVEDIPTAEQLMSSPAVMVGLPCDVVDDLPYGHLELRELHDTTTGANGSTPVDTRGQTA